jgi:hypothetical protein
MPKGYFTMLDLDKDKLEVLLENPFTAVLGGAHGGGKT